jgi:penicillin G amidase
MNIKKIIIFSATILAVAAVFFFVIFRSGNIEKINYTMNFSADVNSAVSIIRDRRGIPSIKAENPQDVSFTLGFLHAQDRLLIMEYYRSIAKGNADLVIPGEDGKILSKLVNILEIQKNASRINNNLKDQYQTYIIRYVDGINSAKEKIKNNSFIKRNGNDSPWTADDCISYFILLEWTSAYLSNYELLFPVDANKVSSALNDIVQKDTICPYTEKESSYVKDMKNLYDIIRNRISIPGKGISIVINKTQLRQDSIAVKYSSNSAIFPLYYPLSINLSGKERSVVSCSGMPFFLSSVSNDFSFARYNASLDSIDFYLVPNVQRSGEDMYNTGYDWKAFEKKALPIRIGGDLVRESDVGPVISDIYPKKNDSLCLIIDKLYLDESSVSARFDLQFSKNMREALIAVSADQGYPSSIMLSQGAESTATFSGSISVRTVKNIFARERINPVSKRNLSSIRRSPKKEFLYVSEAVNVKDFPDLAEYSVFCSKEIAQMLDDMSVSDLSFQKMSDILNKSNSYSISKISEQMIKLLENVPVTSAKLSRMYLNEWNGDLLGEKVAPTIAFQVFFSLITDIIGDEVGDDVSSIYNNPALVYEKMPLFLENGNSLLFDNKKSVDDVETSDRIFNGSFLKAMRILHRAYGPEIEKWKWEKISNAVYQMPNVKKRSVFEGPSRGFQSGNNTVEGSVVYTLDNKMIFIPESTVGLLRTDTSYWSSNFAISMDSRSQFYSNRIIPSSINPFDRDDAQFTVSIMPNNSVDNKNRINK